MDIATMELEAGSLVQQKEGFVQREQSKVVENT